MARANASPTWSDPEGSSHNESRLGRCPASHLETLLQEEILCLLLKPSGPAFKIFASPMNHCPLRAKLNIFEAIL